MGWWTDDYAFEEERRAEYEEEQARQYEAWLAEHEQAEWDRYLLAEYADAMIASVRRRTWRGPAAALNTPPTVESARHLEDNHD